MAKLATLKDTEAVWKKSSNAVYAGAPLLLKKMQKLSVDTTSLYSVFR